MLAMRKIEDINGCRGLYGGRWVGMASMQQVDRVEEKRVIREMSEEMCK
jgi:hypothetical protein